MLLILCREGWNGRGITYEILRDYWISKLMSCYLFPLHWFNHRWKEMILYLQNQLKIYKINQKLKTCNHVARLLRLYSATINMCYWHLWTINSSAVFSYIEKTRVKTKKIENIHWSFFFFFGCLSKCNFLKSKSLSVFSKNYENFLQDLTNLINIISEGFHFV